MSPALSDLPVRKVIAVLQFVGFVHTRTSGSHAIFRHADVKLPPFLSTARSSAERPVRLFAKPG